VVQLAGLVNYSVDGLFQFSTLLNTGRRVSVQLAPGINYKYGKGKKSGWQLAMLGNYGAMTSFQFGAVNIGGYAGVQAGALNFAGQSGYTQLGLVNHAGKGRGFMVGLINETDELYGMQFGLVNIA
jgi:hypothetical protein